MHKLERWKDSPRRVMVLLVGGRLTPNFIGVLGYRPSIVECIVSESERHKYEDVVEVLSPLLDVALSVKPIYVDAFDTRQVIEACERLIDKYLGTEIVFNITCSTKVMGIAAYEAAKRAGYSAVYVDTTHGQFLDLTRPSKEPIPLSIGLEDYLGFYGRHPRKTFDFGCLSVPEGTAITAATYLAEAGEATSEVLAWMRRQNRGRGPRTIHAKHKRPLPARHWELLHELEHLGLLSDVQERSETLVSYTIASDADWNFLDGTWLEVHVWDQARRIKDSEKGPLFDECAFSFEIPGDEGARKEIDVGCIHRGQLLHCSCKSEQSPFKTRYLDELRAISTLLGGRFCSRLFVTNAHRPDEESGGWHDFGLFLQQAKDREIVVVTGEELAATGTILRREAEEPTFWRI